MGDTMRDEHNLKYTTEDITNRSWLDLSPNEKLLWWGRPSILNYVPEIVISIAFIGIAFHTMIYPPTILGNEIDLGWYPMIVVVIIILYLFLLLWGRKRHYYVVTDSKFLERYGIIRQERNPIRYNRVANVTTTEPILESLISMLPRINVGHVEISTAEDNESQISYRRVPCVDTVAQLMEDCMYEDLGSANQTVGSYGNGNSDKDGRGGENGKTKQQKETQNTPENETGNEHSNQHSDIDQKNNNQSKYPDQ